MKRRNLTKLRPLLRPNSDARIFEIVSYAILKAFYKNQLIYWGWTLEDIRGEELALYKTGRTNANDGGIDFVMRPLGRFFQVTETTDVRKYFLDIDKIQRYPISFVIKTEDDIESVMEDIRSQAMRVFGISEIVQRYMNCVEEIINVRELSSRFKSVIDQGQLSLIVEELVIQSRLEFNLPVDEDEPSAT